ncbi:Transmembrane protein 88 [Takifugu flavidus]|uniref:Transmembrane protein 88 n=1 Tax=Takifugu flavidus TaxID=433684 RepID=A0A5C6N961_9TELE|nr:Transmembrane protein 88 [Takifugu flavidus]
MLSSPSTGFLADEALISSGPCSAILIVSLTRLCFLPQLAMSMTASPPLQLSGLNHGHWRRPGNAIACGRTSTLFGSRERGQGWGRGGAGGGEAPLELRGSLDCWACSVLVTAQNLLIAAINACLASLVFGSILTPAVVMVTFGFLCHSTVRPHGTTPYCSDLLNDGGCVALLVVGFLLVTPLLVLALAAYCRLARHLQLGLCFIPYSRAVYKNLPARQHRGLGAGCCGGGSSKGGADGGGREKFGCEMEVLKKTWVQLR